jgi:predicted nucleic acid-binding protein
VDEVRDVLTRPEVVAKFPALSPAHVDQFVNDLLAKAALVQDVPPAFALPRDPKDEPYINLAIAAGARFLVTWNGRHLTYLMRQDTPEGVDFCARYPDLKIIDPPAFVREIEATVVPVPPAVPSAPSPPPARGDKP